MVGEWDQWVGGEAEGSDLLTQGLIDRFCATLDLPESGTVAPPGLHWCLAPGAVPTAALGPDGHPPKGDLLPPIPLPRRMWAASRLEFLAPLTAGAPITRLTRVVSASGKEGRSGPLGFVELAMETRADGVPAVREVQTLVYRAAGSAMTPLPGADTPDLSGWDAVRTLTPNEPMLLRFSALTFNAHRIHYDLPYTREVELYPALVVHGPLVASLLLNHAAAAFGPLASASVRAMAPAFCAQPLHLAASNADGQITLSAVGGDGRKIMEGAARL